MEARIGFGMLADAFVEGALLVDEIGAAGARFDSEEKDVCFGQIAMNQADEIRPIGEDLVYGLAGSEVVVAFVKENERRVIRRNEAFVEKEDIAGLGTAKPAIQDVIVRESGGKRTPVDDGG